MTLPEKISVSALRKFTSCELAYFYRYEEREKGTPSGPRARMGHAYDRAVRGVYKAKADGAGVGDTLAVALEEYDDGWSHPKTPWGDDDEYLHTDDEGVQQKAGRSAAQLFVGQRLPHILPADTSVGMEVPYKGIITLRLWIDLLERYTISTYDADGAAVDVTQEVVKDCKVTQSHSAWPKFDAAHALLDWQLNLYAWARAAEGTLVGGMGWEAAKALKTKAEVKAVVVPYGAGSRTVFERHTDATLQRLEQARESGLFMPTARLNGSWMCSERYCPFWASVCPYGQRERVSVGLAAVDTTEGVE